MDKTCRTCKHWQITKFEQRMMRQGDTNGYAPCALFNTCMCCSDTQMAGAIGGGTFTSVGDFGCNQWEER